MNENFNYEYMKYRYGKEHLDDIYSTMLDVYPNIKNPNVSDSINLYELLKKIKYNFDAAAMLTHKYVNGQANGEYDKLKYKQTATCYNACFDGYKDLKHIRAITNLMFLDIDSFPSRQDAEDYKKDITLRYDWIVGCSLSLSRLGLHVIIQVDKIRSNDDYNRKYDFINTEYFDGRMDKHGKSLIRFAIIPYDYNIYINESPNILHVDEIIREKEKSILSGKEKKKIISTAYTFSDSSPLKEIMNDSARIDNLRFRQDADESLFTDPDIPMYVPEGIDVIEIRLYPYRHKKIEDGKRTSTLGAIAAQMIYLNAESPEHTDPTIKESILRYILSTNKEICDPPLPYKEVLNSFDANWEKYEAGELDVSMFYKKKRAFWSKNTTLKGNDKRKVTCRIKNEPIINETKRRIREAIDAMHAIEGKVTQSKVAAISGLGLQTVKKYRDYYKELLNGSYETTCNINVIPASAEIETLCCEDTKTDDEIQRAHITDPDFDCEDISHFAPIDKTEMKYSQILPFEPVTSSIEPDIEQKLTDEQTFSIFQRIYSSIIYKLDKDKAQQLLKRFRIQLNSLPHEDVKLLTIPIEEINESSKFWKYSSLESMFWALCDNL